MINNIKNLTNTFIKKQKITAINYQTLKSSIANMGYTIVEFNAILNEKNVETIIQNLNLKETALKSRGFTYADNNYRLIFINEDLNDDEKLYVLSHEIGHIVCKHDTISSIIGRDVKEEQEANEFSHYLLKQSLLRSLKFAMAKRKKMITVFASVFFVVLALVVIGFNIKKEKSYYGNFYVTTTGDKYHQTECIHVKNNNNIERLTKEQFASGEYKPCGTCLP